MGVLIRFAVSGDIREMCHQVKVRREDQAAQKFLWRDGDSSRSPETYVMQVKTFGASCSPALANYVKNPICENTFVDDWLQSVDSESQMMQLAETVKRIHASGGFEMRQWTSNSKQVMQALEDDCEGLDKRISGKDEAQEKVLGLWWLPGQDLLTFVVKPNLLAKASKERPIKRRVLSVVIWRSNIGWDDDLTKEDEVDWRHWLDLVSKLNTVRIPRCMKWVRRTQTVQMHTFVDASINAYAAVVYLRAEHDGQVHCSLAASKTRVAPLKPVSIPRMELMAAVLGLRLAKCIQNETSVRIHRRTFWTDSKDVLYWIQSDSRKFQQFVALRIGEILEESDVGSWRWVPSAQNVADDGTKWTKTPEIHGSTRWFNGPPFLYLEESQWPCTEKGSAINMLYHAEEQANHTYSWRCILPDLQHFSKLEKLRAALLCVLDFLRIVTKKTKLDGRLELQKMLLLKRSKEMDVIFIRICQEEEFYSEITSLKSGHRLTDRKSLLFKLSPYIDDSGILRIKGRIDNIEGVEVCVKRPIILLRRHRLTYLLVEFYYRKYHHLHNEIVVNELREKRWGVLFTCLTVRAVHLDIATSLSTDSYLCVLKSFVARRGCPRRMLSDNGTNFKGASRILKDEIERISPALIE
ncbi:uncharacterized protein LOC135431215 [Drosophila montana]|uniref:uncharacterized protein LOC135431215 n=1 Tax=Drosophila montana TaxID=40370 RepID=UPI00313C0017